MPTKKKKTNTVTITPTVDLQIRYEDLDNGDFFLNCDGNLCIKCELEDQECLHLSKGNRGYLEADCCGYVVTPVEVTISWKEIK